MPTFFILIIALLFILLFKKTQKQAVGICAPVLDQTVRKNTNKEKALAFIKERGEATNQDIRKHLGVFGGFALDSVGERCMVINTKTYPAGTFLFPAISNDFNY